MNPVKFFIIFIISNFISVDLFANLDLEDINASSETAQTQTSSNANNSRKDGNYVAKEMEPSEDNFMKLYIHSSLGKTEGEVFTVRSAEANLRQGPSIDSRRLITVHTGAKFRKIDERDLWVQVLVPKKLVMQIAYCHFDHCKLEGKLVTMTSKAYLYAFPSDISLKLNEFDEGAQFKHLVSYEPWRKVQIGPLPTEIQAYIHTSLLDVVDGVAKIKVAYATVRKGPSTRYKEVYTAKRNDKFIFLSYSGKWAHVAIPDTYANAVRQEIKMGRVIRVVSVLNFRSGPSTSHRIIGSLRNNERFEVLASKDNWYKINYRRQVGWVHKNYVQLLSDSADLPVPESAKSEPSNEPNQPTLPKSDNSGDDAGSRNLDTRETSNNVARSGRQVEIRGVPEFAQRGSDPYSSNGQSWRPHAYCGPTSMQMVLAYHGVKRSRDWIAMTHPTTGRRVQSSSHRGQVYAKGAGSAYAPMVNLAKRLGFNASRQVWTNNLNTVKQMIEAGRPQIVSVYGRIRYKGGGSWSTNGHIMVVRGFDSAGDVIVNDPAGNGRRKVIRRSDFMRIWQGFTVDIRKA